MRMVVLTILLSVVSTLTAQQQPKTEQEREGAKIYNQAVEKFSAGEYAASIPLFLTADSLIGATLLVDRLQLRYALGVAHLKTSEPDRALEYFEWVAAQDSTYPYIYLQAAESAQSAKQPAKALKYYRKALESAQDAEKPVILSNIGELLFRRGDLDGALKNCNQAIALSPAPGYYLLRGRIYDKLAGRIDHADESTFDFEEAIRNHSLTEEQMLEAVDLRQKALDDYRLASRDEKLAQTAKMHTERSNAILENNRAIISEIRYQRENP